MESINSLVDLTKYRDVPGGRVSIIPKFHDIFFHVREFCQKHQTGLSFYSEQACESFHSMFAKFFGNYSIADITKDGFLDKLFSATIKLASLNVIVVQKEDA